MKVLIKVIDLTTLVIGLILGTRVILKILGAGVEAPFVRWVYTDLSLPLLLPFEGIFPAPSFGKNGIVDIPAFFAVIIYLAIGYMISAGLESLGRNVNIPNPFRLTGKKEEKKVEKTKLSRTTTALNLRVLESLYDK